MFRFDNGRDLIIVDQWTGTQRLVIKKRLYYLRYVGRRRVANSAMDISSDNEISEFRVKFTLKGYEGVAIIDEGIFGPRHKSKGTVACVIFFPGSRTDGLTNGDERLVRSNSIRLEVELLPVF